jgi:hypothetical protein
MSVELTTVVRRRQALVARAAAQRAELAELAAPWQQPLRIADAAYRVGRAVRTHQALVTLATTLLVLMPQRHRLLMWAGRLFSVWEIYRVVREQWPPRPRGAQP